MALKAAWGPLLARRQQGLSKMMACSVFLHVSLFLFIVLNRMLFGSSPPAFRGFQVSLVAPAVGMAVSGGGGGKSLPAEIKKIPRRTSPKSQISKGSRESAPATPKLKKAKGLASLPISATSKAVLKPKAPAVANRVRAPRSSVNASPPAQDDPEQLQEWWKKKKKNLKLPSNTTARKPKMGVSRRTRTAKIDIEKRPIVDPSPLKLEVPAATPKPLANNADTQNQITSKLETPLKRDPEPSSPQENGNETEPSENAQGNSEPAGGETGTDPGAIESTHAAITPGIKGLGVAGTPSFFFPGYLQKVDHKIRWDWAPPPVSSVGDRLVIRFVIEKNGRIDRSSVEIEESSGNHFFDQSALRAVLAARSLPPLPKSYNGKTLTVFMNFVVSEDS